MKEIKTLRDYIDNRKVALNSLYKRYWLEIDKHRLEELEQLDKFINEHIII